MRIHLETDDAVRQLLAQRTDSRQGPPRRAPAFVKEPKVLNDSLLFSPVKHGNQKLSEMREVQMANLASFAPILHKLSESSRLQAPEEELRNHV